MKPFCVVFSVLAAPGFAQPMWEVASQWDCSLERHMRAPTGADVIEMDPAGRRHSIDFETMTVTSAFVDGTADIVQRSHHLTDGVEYNIIVNAWPYGEFPSVYMEQDGVAWSVGGSGSLEPGDDVWVAVYRCVPSGTGS